MALAARVLGFAMERIDALVRSMQAAAALAVLFRRWRGLWRALVV
jgi:hypothetical protein